MKLITWILVSVLFSVPSIGSEEHKEHGEEEGGVSASVGPEKAVEAASKKEGVKLSSKAISTLGVETQKMGSAVPLSSLVFFQDEVGLYRLRNGWYKLIEVTIVQKTPTTAIIESQELTPDDQIVVKGVPLLRVAELEAFGGSGEGHGH